MTVLGIPVINRPDLLYACIRSIDLPVRLVVIDNSETGELGQIALTARADVHVVKPITNLGVAGSWNYIIRTFDEPYWLIANADAVFGAGDLGRLVAEVSGPGARWVGVNGDWRVFGINRPAIERVGYFDENFHPIYCEDADYEYRCRLAGVPYYSIAGGTTHVGSASLSEEPGRSQNARTYAANLAYYKAKWGGPIRGGETYATPFDSGQPVSSWTPDPERTRELAWA